TPEESEEESNDEEDQDLRLSEEARIHEEEDADELYRDVNINQGKGLQVTQNVEDTHVTLTPVNPDGPQESEPPIPPPTIPSIIFENLPTFNSAFHFKERLRSLETSFSEYRQTNLFADVVSAIPENDEFLCNVDENMKKIIKGQVKNQVKEQVSCILPRINESVNATLEAEVLTRSSQSSRTSYAIAADLSEMELKKILIENMEGNNEKERMMTRKDPPLDQTGGLKDKKKEQALHLKRLPGVKAELPKGLNLDKCLPGEYNTDFHPMVDFIAASPLRRNLKLRDEDGISSLPDTELFENLTLMGRIRNAQSSILPTVADEPASLMRDVSEWEACPTEFGFIADQDRATIAMSSTLPHDSAPRVTSHAADEGSSGGGNSQVEGQGESFGG
nr:hypothetical protein [Tanacetum cinerariifolium]